MTCYDPQGNNLAGKAPPKWYPCNYTTSDGFVPCCQPDLGPCLENLACGFNDQPETLIRGGCTDFTFRSPSCPQFLLDVDPNRPDNLIHNCLNGTGCFNETAMNSQNNCSCAPGSPNLLLIFSNSIISATTAGSAASTSLSTTSKSTTSSVTSTSFLTTTSSSSTASTNSLVMTGTATQSASATAAPQSNGSDLGVKVGVPVGVIGGLALVAILGYFSWKRCFGKRGHPGGTGDTSEPGVLVEVHEFPTKLN